MEITIYDNLKEYRKNKGNTQEELAEFIGISVQAVSKWERNESYPDITLLPRIAVFYDATVDDLLGVGDIKKKERINEYDAKSGTFRSIGDMKSDFELWSEAIRDFPNDVHVMVSYMYALFNYQEDNHRNKIIDIGEKILNQPALCQFDRDCAIQVLCYTYIRMGDKEKAKGYAYKAPGGIVTADNLLRGIYEGEERRKHIQRMVLSDIENIQRDIMIMADSAGGLSNDEAKHAHQFAVKLFELLFENGDYGFYFIRVVESYAEIAIIDAKEKRLDETKYDTRIDGNYTSPLVNRLDHKRTYVYTSSMENQARETLNRMKWEAFDFCREAERFKEIEKNLEKYAN